MVWGGNCPGELAGAVVWGNCPGDDSPGGYCLWRQFAFGGNCPGGYCLGGLLSWGQLSRGNMQGGSCPGAVVWGGIVLISLKQRSIRFNLKPFTNKPWFSRAAVQVFRKHSRKRRNCSWQAISPFPTALFTSLESFCHFHQIWNCRLQTLSVSKSLKIVVWKRVKQGSIRFSFKLCRLASP